MTGRSLFLTATALLCAAPAGADSIRCGSRLVSEGDTAEKLRKRCGEPVEVSRQQLLRGPYVWHDNRYTRVAPGSPIEYAVELWTYNFGPKRFMARVRLEAGVVTAIETLGYGYR